MGVNFFPAFSIPMFLSVTPGPIPSGQTPSQIRSFDVYYAYEPVVGIHVIGDNGDEPVVGLRVECDDEVSPPISFCAVQGLGGDPQISLQVNQEPE